MQTVPVGNGLTDEVQNFMITRARPEHAATLTQLAFAAKRHLGYPEQWINHWESDLTITADFINHNHVYIAEEAGEILGFYALGVAGTKADLEHLWVTPASSGSGIGKELFLDAMERAAKLSATKGHTKHKIDL